MTYSSAGLRPPTAVRLTSTTFFLAVAEALRTALAAVVAVSMIEVDVVAPLSTTASVAATADSESLRTALLSRLFVS